MTAYAPWLSVAAIQPYGDGTGVRGKPFRLGERQSGRTEPGERIGCASHQGGALQKIGDAQPPREARRTRGRQDMIGSGDVVADCFGRMATKEDRAGVGNPPAERLGRLRLHRQLDMFGGNAIDDRSRLAEIGHEDDSAVVAPAPAAAPVRSC